MPEKTEHYRPNSRAYVSEFDQFMHEFLDRHPEVVEDRQRGWYIWWDRRIDLDEVDKLSKEEVAEKPYHYE